MLKFLEKNSRLRSGWSQKFLQNIGPQKKKTSRKSFRILHPNTTASQHYVYESSEFLTWLLVCWLYFLDWVQWPPIIWVILVFSELSITESRRAKFNLLYGYWARKGGKDSKNWRSRAEVQLKFAYKARKVKGIKDSKSWNGPFASVK